MTLLIEQDANLAELLHSRPVESIYNDRLFKCKWIVTEKQNIVCVDSGRTNIEGLNLYLNNYKELQSLFSDISEYDYVYVHKHGKHLYVPIEDIPDRTLAYMCINTETGQQKLVRLCRIHTKTLFKNAYLGKLNKNDITLAVKATTYIELLLSGKLFAFRSKGIHIIGLFHTDISDNLKSIFNKHTVIFTRDFSNASWQIPAYDSAVINNPRIIKSLIYTIVNSQKTRISNKVDNYICCLTGTYQFSELFHIKQNDFQILVSFDDNAISDTDKLAEIRKAAAYFGTQLKIDQESLHKARTSQTTELLLKPAVLHMYPDLWLDNYVYQYKHGKLIKIPIWNSGIQEDTDIAKNILDIQNNAVIPFLIPPMAIIFALLKTYLKVEVPAKWILEDLTSDGSALCNWHLGIVWPKFYFKDFPYPRGQSEICLRNVIPVHTCDDRTIILKVYESNFLASLRAYGPQVGRSMALSAYKLLWKDIVSPLEICKDVIQSTFGYTPKYLPELLRKQLSAATELAALELEIFADRTIYKYIRY